MKNIKKKIEGLFKNFFYKVFALFHGKVKGHINYKDDSRIKVETIDKENNFKYKIFKVSKGRLYTDRIHDTAIILDNLVIEGPSYQLRPINDAGIKENIVFKKGTPRKKKNINGKILSLLTGGAGNENYFHWLYDVLPRIALYEEISDMKDINFFLVPSYEKKFQIQTLELLNIPKNKCLSSRFFRHIESSEIIITQHPYVVTNNSTEDIQNIPVWISKWLKKKYINIESQKSFKFDKKIYIDRKDSTSNTKKLRSIINEDEIKLFLEKHGFKTITLSEYDFIDQVKIFNNAEFIVGLHGAGFANLCFCNPGTKVIELKSNTAGKMYENIAVTNSLNYHPLSCEVEKFGENNQFGHIKVSTKLLEEIIKKIN